MQTWQVCPKCKGKLFIDSDFNGWYVECLMCGFFHDLEELDVPQGESIQVELTLSQNTVSSLLPESRAKYA